MGKLFEVIIVGGGTAGWMTAAALSVKLTDGISVRLIESDEIASVGVGEATLPQLKDFNRYIGLDEADMMSKTGATFKLGIEFVNWGRLNNTYIHPFGGFGEPIGGAAFHQQWRRVGCPDDFGSYSYAVQAARHYRFEFPSKNSQEINSTYSYAYHFDAGLYAAYLRQFSEKNGVKRQEGKIVEVNQQSTSGEITSVRLASGELLQADFFIDCSGFRSLLLGKTLKAEFEDWSSWLVCDRALAVPTKTVGIPFPCTRSIAKNAGWQWRIPLQHRVGNGYVFSSQFISDEDAVNELLAGLDGEVLADPKLIKFKSGRYKSNWEKNCIAVGLSSGFLEPLESTSIYLIQVAVLNFLKLFPYKNNNFALAKEFNRLMDMEYNRIRDFLILHYHLTDRTDAPLWEHCRNMPIPESLQQKLDNFRYRGYVDEYDYGLFNIYSWLSVLVGQGARQQFVDPYTNNYPVGIVSQKLENIRLSIYERVVQMPGHDELIKQYCPINIR